MTGPIRVALDMTFPDRRQGAVGRYARRLLRELASRHDVVPVRIGERPGCGTATTLRWLTSEASLAAGAGGAGLVHCPASVAPWRMPVPVVLTVHDNAVRRYPGGYSAEWRAYAGAVLPRRARAAAAVITPSETVRRELVAAWGLDPERVVAVPMGVGAEFRPGRTEAMAGRPRVLFVGPPIERKNLGVVVRALGIARPGSALAAAELTIAGARAEDFPEHRRAVTAAGVASRVRWLGQVRAEDMPAVYRAADVLVYPPLEEGFGLAALEAMACGTPVVAGTRGSVPEVVGDAALLVDPTSPEAVSYELERALADAGQRARLSEAGLRRAAEFTWARCAAATCGVYRLAARDVYDDV